jgi:hypothetical protein
MAVIYNHLNPKLGSNIHSGIYMAHVLSSYNNETDCIYKESRKLLLKKGQLGNPKLNAFKN